MKRLLSLVLCFMLLSMSIATAETPFDASKYSLTELMEIRASIDEQIQKLAFTPSEELQPGQYIAGEDIAAGTYIVHGLMEKGPSGYTPQISIADSTDQAANYEYKYHEYLKTNEKFYINVATGSVLKVSYGSVSIEPAPVISCSPESNGVESGDALRTSTLVPGYYIAGEDIFAGVYILQGLMDKGPDGYTPQVCVANSMEDAEYYEYRESDYLNQGSLWRVRLETGNVLKICSGDVCVQEVSPLTVAPGDEEQRLYEKESKRDALVGADDGNRFTVYKGVYIVGRDILAGSYTLTMTDCKSSTVVATFANNDDLTSYTSWSSANNLAEYGKSAFYVKKDTPVHIRLEDGDRLYIADGQGYITESDSSVIMKGIYTVGKEIQPGPHVITLTDIHGSVVIATFSSTKDLLSYVTWDSANNLKEFGKTAVYAKSDTPVHIYLEQGDYLLIKDGSGTIAEAQDGVLVKGVYPIGKELKPGSYLITLKDFHNSATVATFANNSDMVSYISWDSANNLKEYSTASLSVKKGQQFHLTLIEGEYLYISDGTGTYTIQ